MNHPTQKKKVLRKWFSKQNIEKFNFNPHQENWRVEQRTSVLEERRRDMLLHAIHKWPNAITTHQGPYAHKLANTFRKSRPAQDDWRHNKLINQFEPHALFCLTSIFAEQMSTAKKKQDRSEHRWLTRSLLSCLQNQILCHHKDNCSLIIFWDQEWNNYLLKQSGKLQPD